ncbi:MAG: DUF3352 domain-containing protein [Acidothermus sp.]|nr:DUF3352 domain-containing protein [Acidothermus sp.]
MPAPPYFTADDAHAGRPESSRAPSFGDVLPPAPPAVSAPSRSRHGRTVAILGTVLAVLAAGGGVGAYRVMAHHGTAGVEALAPSSAFSFIKLDLSPGGSAEADALAFANHVPGSPGFKNAVELRDTIVRRSLGTYASEYDAMVKPWLGDEIAAGAFVSAGTSQGFTLVRVTDAAKAAQAMKALAALPSRGRDTNRLAYRVTDGFLVLAESQAVVDDLITQAHRQSLAKQATYTADMASVGSGQILVGWVDLAKTTSLLEQQAAVEPGAATLLQGLDVSTPRGRLVFVGSVHPTSIDLDARVLGAPASQWSLANLNDLLGRLPSDSQFAFAVAGADRLLESVFTGFTKSPLGATFLGNELNDLEAETGLRLPDDLYALVGSELAVGASEGGPSGESEFTVLTKPKNPAAAARVATLLQGLAEAAGQRLRVTNGSPLVITTHEGDGGVLRDDPTYVAAMEGMPAQVAAAGYATISESRNAPVIGGLGFYVTASKGSTPIAHLRFIIR